MSHPPSALLLRRPLIALISDRARPHPNNLNLTLLPIHLIEHAQTTHPNPPHILIPLKRRAARRIRTLAQRTLRLLHTTPRRRMQAAVFGVRIVLEGDAPEQMAGGYWSARKK